MIIGFHNEDAVARIVTGVTDTTLPKSEWTHAAHFAIALWLLRQGGAPVSECLPPLIRRYNEATGLRNTDTTGYHETITQASIRAAADWSRRFVGDHPVHDVVNQLMQSNLGRSDWLLAFWSRERLFSTAARRQWQAPDLHPLPY